MDIIFRNGEMKPGSQVNTVNNSGHQLCIDNPIGCCAAVVGFVFGEEVKYQYLEECPEPEAEEYPDA